MTKQLEPRFGGGAPAPLDQVRRTVHSDLQYVSLQVDGKTYGGWYRMLPDGRMELLALANMHCERRAESTPVEQARGMLAEFIRAARPRSGSRDSAAIVDEQSRAAAPTTLGTLLYADASKSQVAEAEWVGLVQSVAARDLQALRELFERTQCIVFTLIFRLIDEREIAEELTLEVYQDVWRQASQFDAANDTVLGWIMNQARFRAITRLDLEQHETNSPASPTELAAAVPTSAARRDLEAQQQREHVRDAVVTLDSHERHAIESAYFSKLDRTKAAEKLAQSIESVTAHIHSGLDKLQRGLRSEVKQ